MLALLHDQVTVGDIPASVVLDGGGRLQEGLDIQALAVKSW